MKKEDSLYVYEGDVILEKPLKSLGSKPYFAIYVSIAMAIFLIVTVNIQILGWIILPFAIFVLIKGANQRLIDFYQDHFVYFKSNTIYRVRYDEISEWSSKQGNQMGDLILVKLNNGQFVNIETYRAAAIVKQFNRLLGEKEASRVKNKKMKNTPCKWPWK